jgi:hypothetical protein
MKTNHPFAGLLAQGHKHLFASLFNLTDRILDNRIVPRESFLLQNLPNLFGGMTLLLGNLFVSLYDSFYAINVWPDL